MFVHGYEGHSPGSEYGTDQAWPVAGDELSVLEVDDAGQVEAHAFHAVHSAAGVVLHHDGSFRGGLDSSLGMAKLDDEEASIRAQRHCGFESYVSEALFGLVAVDGHGEGEGRTHVLCPETKKTSNIFIRLGKGGRMYRPTTLRFDMTGSCKAFITLKATTSWLTRHLLSFSWTTSLRASASPFNRKKDTGYPWLSTSNAPAIYLPRGGSFAVKYADNAAEAGLHKDRECRVYAGTGPRDALIKSCF